MVDKKPNKTATTQPNKETVYIDVEDDIATIIDKVEAAKAKIVALVLPKRSTVLQSTVNMRLLKRSADNNGKSVVLITSDSAVSPLAGIAGLHVAKNLQSRPEIPSQISENSELTDVEESEERATLDYHRSIGELAASNSLDEPEEIDMADDTAEKLEKPTKKTREKKIKIPDFDKFRLRLLIFAAFGISVIVFAILAIFVLPKTTIIVKTGGVEVSTEFELSTSGKAESLDVEKSIIPSTSQTKDQTVQEQVPASGERNDGEKSEGEVTLSIPCSQVSGSPPNVPAGTGVSTSGLTYVTQQSATLDNPDFSDGCHFTDDVDVVAQDGGAKYNIGPSSFSVAGYPSIGANSSSSMAGGTDKITKIVSQADVDKVRQKITSENSDEFTQAFLNELDQLGLYAVEPTIKLSDPKTSVNPAVGQPASTANVTVKVTYRVMAVKKEDLSKAITDNLNKQLDPSKQEMAVDDVLEGVSVNVSDQKSPTDAKLEISQTAVAVPIIKEDDVKALAAGQKTSTIKNGVSAIPGVEDVEIIMSPFWVSVAPKKESKITVIQEQIVTMQSDDQSESTESVDDQNP